MKGAKNDQIAVIAQLEAMAEASGITINTFNITDYEAVTSPSDMQITGSTIKEYITSAFSQIKAGCSSKDILLFYYAGHGLGSSSELNGKLVFSSGYSTTGTDDYSMTVDELADSLSSISCNKVIILDSCYSGAHVDNSFNSFSNALKSLFTKRETANTWIIAAASESEESREAVIVRNGKSHGFFTYALLSYFGYDFVNEASSCTSGSYTINEAATYAKDNIIYPYSLNQHVTLLASNNELKLYSF